MNVAKKKEAPAQTTGGKPIKKAKTTKKAVKKTAPKKGKTKAEILAKPTKVVRKSVVKNEEHSDFEDTADVADDVEREDLADDDLDVEGSEDDNLEY